MSPLQEVRADLIVDAVGRRSLLPQWLRDVGAIPVHEEAEDCGFIYYSRYFRPSDGGSPQPRAGTLSPIGSFSILTVPGDANTWSVTLYISSHDRPLKRLRDQDRWTAVLVGMQNETDLALAAQLAHAGASSTHVRGR